MASAPGAVDGHAVRQPITGFHVDDVGDWVAELACGHGQHMRHDPPWQVRPWVLTAAGRASFLGFVLECVRCDRDDTPPPPPARDVQP